MNKETKKKVKLIVRTVLCANKGKSFTSKDLANFISDNKLGVRDGVNAQELGGVMNYQFCYHYGIDRERKSGRNVWHYKMVD